MVLSLLINGALDIGFGIGWWIVKKVGNSVYDLSSHVFYEKIVGDEKKKEDELKKIIEILEHDLVEIKHTQETILHRLEEDKDKDNHHHDNHPYDNN